MPTSCTCYTKKRKHQARVLYMEKGNIQFWFGFVFSFTIGEKKRGTLHIPNNLTYVLLEKKTVSCPYITREKFNKIEKNNK